MLRLFHWTTTLLAIILPVMLASSAPFAAQAAGEDDIPGVPTLVHPESGIATTGINYPPMGIPTFVWNAVPEATKYRIQVSNSSGFANLAIDQTTYATSFTPLTHLADGEYYWRVQAYQGFNWGSYSETYTFTKDWGDNGQIRPILVSPVDGDKLGQITSTDFSWQSVPGAAAYLFEISSEPSINSVIYSATTLKAQHAPLARLKNDQYYWRVTPLDNQKNPGQPSEIRTFKFDWISAPILLAPLNLIETPFTPEFTWSAVESAQSYQIEISTQPDFSTTNVYVTYLPQFVPEKALSNDQDYYWRVKAIDHIGNSTSWSETRQFRRRWDFQAQLLTPINNSIHQSYPFFSWTPIPGAERYQIQVDESTSFANPLVDIDVFNVTTTSLTKLKDPVIQFEKDYYWRVRGVDAQDNYTPWSDEHAFRFGSETSPSLIYPLYYYAPDSENLPVHSDASIAWPLFMWDIALKFDASTKLADKPDFYEVTVSSDPGFQNVNFQIETSGIAVAPTTAHPFINVVDNQNYYWRVRAIKGDEQVGIDAIGLTHIDLSKAQLPTTEVIAPIYPSNGFEAVDTPPVLGWQPVQGAVSYRVEISRDPQFATIVDAAEPQFVNYVPWQGRRERMPNGMYWWRVRAESAAGVALGGWSEARAFILSVDLIAGNPYDFVPPAYPYSIISATLGYDPALNMVSASAKADTNYALGNLHVMLNNVNIRPLTDAESGSGTNLNWIIAFETAFLPDNNVTYGIYIDIDHAANSGATSDPLGKPIAVNEQFLPEYVIYINRTTNEISAKDVSLFTWTTGGWSPAQSLNSIGGDAWFDSVHAVVQIVTPYTAIGAGDTDFSGSMALTVFSTDQTANMGMVDAVPTQNGIMDNPVFVSDMVTPLYPFDTPLFNPLVQYDLPILRWRMPYFDSVDGYEVQVARDIHFTAIVETWNFSEKNTSSPFSWLPTAFHSMAAYEDNESYYWRVRIRHERYTQRESDFEYGPWSSVMRFKLDSRQVAGPRLSTGEFVGITPAFGWARVEGVSGYTIQIAEDATFKTPLINQKVDEVSYTPTNTLPDGNYYWRVAMRRSDKIIGHWTQTMNFQKNSIAPVPVSPVNNEVVNQQPAFTWEPVFVITGTNRVAATLYQIQIDDDPNFGSPSTYKTAFTTFALSKAQSLQDGKWYWRVATIDAKKNVGTYSAVQQFYKEYTSPQLVTPVQAGEIDLSYGFEWIPIDGAASYEVQLASDIQFNGAIILRTDNTRFTPTVRLNEQEYYWRVRMFDFDKVPGPYQNGKISMGSLDGASFYLPVIQKP